MTDLEKELLESRSNIYEKISKVEQDKLEGNSFIDTKTLRMSSYGIHHL